MPVTTVIMKAWFAKAAGITPARGRVTALPPGVTCHLVIFQDDLSSAHFADKLQKLAVLHLRVGVLAQQVR